MRERKCMREGRLIRGRRWMRERRWLERQGHSDLVRLPKLATRESQGGHVTDSVRFHCPHVPCPANYAARRSLVQHCKGLHNCRIDHRDPTGMTTIRSRIGSVKHPDEEYFYCQHDGCGSRHLALKHLNMHCKTDHSCYTNHVYTQVKGVRPAIGTHSSVKPTKAVASGQTSETVPSAQTVPGKLFFCAHNRCSQKYMRPHFFKRHCAEIHECQKFHYTTPSGYIVEVGPPDGNERNGAK